MASAQQAPVEQAAEREDQEVAEARDSSPKIQAVPYEAGATDPAEVREEEHKGGVFGVVPEEAGFPVQGIVPGNEGGEGALEEASPTPEPPVPVMEVVFEGLVARGAAELEPQLSTKQGEPFDTYLLQEDVARLAAVFRKVDARTKKLESGGLRVVFKVEEYPQIRELTFVGNHKLEADRAAKIAKLKVGDGLDDKAVEVMRRALLEEYDRIGLTEARVDVSIKRADEAGAAKADLQVIIQEGGQTVVDDVEVKGNKAFSTLRLRLYIKTKGSWWFYQNFYDDAAFEEDLTALRLFYTANGYFDAKVERGEFRSAMRGEMQHLTPVIQISEGGRYSLGEVDANGTRLFSKGELLAPFKDLKGHRFDGKKFGAAVERAQGLYLDKGFLSSEVKPDYAFDAQSLRVNVTLDVTEKECIYVGRVQLKRPDFDADAATTPTLLRKLYDHVAPPLKEKAILRDVLLKPGEVYSKRKERETMRRLERTGIFRDASGEPAIHIKNLPTANPAVNDAEIELGERSTGNVGGGGGFGDVSGIFGYVVLEERNLFGEARDIRLQTKLGTRLGDVTLSYLDRHFKGGDDQVGAAAYYNRVMREGFRERLIGTNVEVTRTLPSGWDRAIRGRLESVGLTESGAINAKEDLNASYKVLTGRILFAQDTREPADMPTEGRYLGGALEAGYAGGPLIKLSGEGDYHFKLRRNLMYHLNPSIGLMPFDASTVGLGERFFLGGTDDMRGFKPRGAGLRDSRESEIAVGGAFKALARNELLFPVVDPVWGVFFVDAGTLGSNPLRFYEEPRVSTGIGVRVKMRDAMFSLDLALPLVTGKGDQTQLIHFNFTGKL